MRWSLGARKQRERQVLGVGPLERLLPPDKPDHADGGHDHHPVKKPVAMRCATLVRVIEVLPRPMSSHSIVAGWVHWKFTALCWYGNSCAGVSICPELTLGLLRHGICDSPNRSGCGSSICQAMALVLGVPRAPRQPTCSVGVSLAT